MHMYGCVGFLRHRVVSYFSLVAIISVQAHVEVNNPNADFQSRKPPNLLEHNFLTQFFLLLSHLNLIEYHICADIDACARVMC